MSTLSKVISSPADLEAVPNRRRAQRILIVDDNPDNIMLTRELLNSRGYEVISVASAEDAQQDIQRQQPDLILLDVILPGKSGYELCRELKEDPFTRLIPVVMITGLTDREDKIRGIEAGADDFLSKPLYPEELYARVKSLLKLKHFTDELENAEAVLFTLALGVEARDPFTGDHCSRLAHHAAALGRHLHFDYENIVALERGGYLHDLGKIKVPDEILRKGSELTLAEWEIMKQHPATGEAICAPLKSFRKVLPIIRHHHEHWNGSGYPDGLEGHNIPVLARVLQVVDVFDALTTARPYKPAIPHTQTKETMLREAKRGLWDYELVREFFGMLEAERRAA
jgi:putative two-component system response regulator